MDNPIIQKQIELNNAIRRGETDGEIVDIVELTMSLANNAPVADLIDNLLITEPTDEQVNAGIIRHLIRSGHTTPINNLPINNLPVNLENEEVLSDTSDENDIVDDLYNSYNILRLPDLHPIYLSNRNDFKVLINNCNEQELIDLKKQFEEKSENVLFENKILSKELKRLHRKFIDANIKYEIITDSNETDVKLKRKIYNYRILKDHYINRMAIVEGKFQEIVRLLIKIKGEILILSKLKKFEASTQKALCFICCDSETTVTLDCKHELCMKCVRKIKERCPFCRRLII